MKRVLGIAALLTLSGAIAATAAASGKAYIVGTKSVKGVGTTGSFQGSVKKPYKIILFCEGVKARCGSKVVCARGTTMFIQSRSGLTPGTWNLKKPTWHLLDNCHFRVTIKSGAESARATVQAEVRS